MISDLATTDASRSSKGRTNLFFASSPRHIFLAAGLALREPDARNELFVIEHLPADAVTVYLDLLAAWPSSPFSAVTRLLGDHRAVIGEARGLGGRWRKGRAKRAFRRTNRSLIEASLEQVSGGDVYVGCDNYYETQFALSLAKSRDVSARGILIEDGVAVYDYDFRDRPLRRLRDRMRRLSYGSFWRACRIIGTSGWVDEACVAFPELVIDELKRLDLHGLPREAFLSDAFRELATPMTQGFGVDLEALSKASLIVAITRSGPAKAFPGYVETILDLCTTLTEAGHTVAVKYHPREGNPDFIPLRGMKGIHVVPSSVLFELLITMVDNPDLTVIGDASTALLATRWLRPEIRIIAMRHGTSGPASRFLSKQFEALEIPIESDPRQIRDKYFV